MPLDVVDVTSDNAAATEAARLLERYERTIFDYPNEWPIRMAVVLVNGVPILSPEGHFRGMCFIVRDVTAMVGHSVLPMVFFGVFVKSR